MGDLLSAEINEKQARSIRYQITIAKLPLARDLADFTLDGTPVNETLVRDLAAGNFIAHQGNIMLVGCTGTGKSHLAIAIAIGRACIRDGARGRFFNVVDLVNRFEAEARSAASRQPERGPPGLSAFKRLYFDAVPLTRPGRYRRRPKSLRLIADEQSEAVGVLTETPGLRRLEFRMSPMNKVRDYRLFLRGWAELEKRLRRTRPLPDIRFAIHFMRRLKGGPLEAIRQLDRYAAAFQLFRHNHPEEAAKIARIDVAGPERLCSSRMFSAHFRLLRGDIAVVKAVRDGSDPQRLFERCRDLHARGALGPVMGAERLGGTCHAGEDMADLILGVHEVAEAIQGLNLGPGDSIGHGLALAWPAEAFARQRRSRLMTWGDHFDSLCWLLAEATAEGSFTDQGLIRALEARVGEAARHIYPCIAVDGLSWASLAGPYWEARLPLPQAGAPGDPPTRRVAVQFAWASITEGAVQGRRSALRSGTDRAVFDPMVSWVQARVRERVARRGIVIEVNPASNLRITASERLHDTPTLALMTAAEALQVAINTDDPGVFGSCIENEYAMVHEALSGVGLSRDAILQRLDAMRRTGLEAIRWPAASESAGSEIAGG